MATALPDWPREFYRHPGGEPYLFFAVYGAFSKLGTLPAADYRSAGVPDGLKFKHYTYHDHPQVLARFLEGYAWEELKGRDAKLADRVGAAQQLITLRGQLPDASKLNYLRDAVGLVTYLLDRGGVAVYDPQILHWWDRQVWRQRIFAPAGPVPTHHVVILTTPEVDGRLWLHTRGLRKFGRPDLSLRLVPPALAAAATELCHRFIMFQALGGVVEDGQPLKMKGLPDGLAWRRQGGLDDLDFDNFSVEIVIP